MVLASARTAVIGDTAAEIAAAQSGVPLSVLRSITRTDTGRNRGGASHLRPWTVNMKGTGKRFDTQDAARACVFKHFKRGARSFYPGCFQINHKWHGEAVRSTDGMVGPPANARCVTRFLSRVHGETGGWSRAAEATHPRRSAHAEKHRPRFDRIHRKMEGQPLPNVAALAQAASGLITKARRAARVNIFPRLQSGRAAGQRGSLVHPGQGSARALIRFSHAGQGG